MKEPSRLQSMGLARVRHDLATKPPPPETGLQGSSCFGVIYFFYFFGLRKEVVAKGDPS